jgi:hypothetical protein
MTTLRALESRDLAPLAETLPSGFPNTTTATWLQRFENWWTSNPAFTPGFPRGWVLEEDGALAGFIGNVPVRFTIRGETGIAAASASWYVDPSVRGLASIGLLKEYLSQGDVDLFLFWNDKPDLLKVVSKYGFRKIPCRTEPSEYLYIIDRTRFLHRKNLAFLLRKYIAGGDAGPHGASPERLRRIGTFAYSYLFRPGARAIGGRGGEYTSTLCTSCDDAFTRLWDPHLESFEIALSRDSSTLNWLYFTAGRRYNRKVIQCRRPADNSLVGYMVFDFIPWDASGGGAMRLMDMCILNDDQQVLGSLISCAVEVGEQNDAPFLLMWADSPAVDRSLRKALTVSWPAEYYSYIRLSDALESGPDPFRIYSCLMNPPRGIDH